MVKHLALLSLLLTGCTDIGARVIMPPAQYTGRKVVAQSVMMPERFIDHFCSQIGIHKDGRGRIEACTWRDQFGWHHALPSDADPQKLSKLITHEDAHLPPMAWPWNHPGGTYQ